MTAGLDPDEGLAEQGYERHPDHLRMLARLGRWVENTGSSPPFREHPTKMASERRA